MSRHTLPPGGSRACPKCATPLTQVLHDDARVDTCSSCRGIWVDHMNERTLLKFKPEVFTIAELRRLRKLYQPLGAIEEVRYVPCPICRKLMQRVNWGSHSGVVVERCGDHGTWYDEGEVEKIRESVSLGGIEFEKYRLTERGLIELETKLDREVTKLDRRIDSAYRRARLWSILGF
jgi:Zn-finger nucleic acid-binding protein